MHGYIKIKLSKNKIKDMNNNQTKKSKKYVFQV